MAITIATAPRMMPAIAIPRPGIWPWDSSICFLPMKPVTSATMAKTGRLQQHGTQR